MMCWLELEVNRKKKELKVDFRRIEKYITNV